MRRKRLRHRVAVITGASSGIGRATALAFADAGAVVVVTGRRIQPLRQLVHDCRTRGVEAAAMAADVTDLDALETVARETAGRFGRIDIWVNNAAVNVYGRLEEVPPGAWRRVVETNVFGTYHGTRAVLPWMREQGSGVIINVASILSWLPSPLQSAYVASKHAVRALSESTRQEVRDVADIAVCTVLPGAVDTPLYQQAGKYAGRRAKPPPPVMSADRVASAILACARRPRREATVGRSAGAAGLLGRLWPSAAERLAAPAIEREHFLDEPAQPTEGNLWEPDGFGADISGGWKSDARARWRAAVTLAAAVAAAGVAKRRPR